MPGIHHDKRLPAELAAELGWYPADLDNESITRHRADAAHRKTDSDGEEMSTLDRARAPA